MKTWLVIAAINGFLAVAAGAFATHGLQSRLDAHAMEIFQTAARYHMYHALAIGLVAVAMRERAGLSARLAVSFFLAGIVLFCGSLYFLALTGNHALVIATPLGGTAFLIGWGTFVSAALGLKS